MKRLALALFILPIALGTNSYAEESLLGTYRGSFQGGKNNNKTNGVSLIIESVENGIVKGTATRFQKGACNGDYLMEGELSGKTLTMKSTEKGGRLEDCSFGINVTQDGNTLVGKTHKGQPIQLSK